MDPYELLQIPRTADARTARLAFLHIARTCHPDKGGDPRLYKALQTAYNTIKHNSQQVGGESNIGHNDLKSGHNNFNYNSIKYSHRIDPSRYNPHSFNEAYNAAHGIPNTSDPMEERTLADLERENAMIEHQLGDISRIFKGGRFSSKTFNRIFEHYQDSHRQKSPGGLEEVQGDPQPMMAAGDMAFSTVGDPTQSANLTSLSSGKVNRIWQGSHQNPNRVDPRLKRRVERTMKGQNTSISREKKADTSELYDRINKYKSESRRLRAQVRPDLDDNETAWDETGAGDDEGGQLVVYQEPKTRTRKTAKKRTTRKKKTHQQHFWPSEYGLTQPQYSQQRLPPQYAQHQQPQYQQPQYTRHPQHQHPQYAQQHHPQYAQQQYAQQYQYTPQQQQYAQQQQYTPQQQHQYQYTPQQYQYTPQQQQHQYTPQQRQQHQYAPQQQQHQYAPQRATVTVVEPDECEPNEGVYPVYPGSEIGTGTQQLHVQNQRYHQSNQYAIQDKDQWNLDSNSSEDSESVSDSDSNGVVSKGLNVVNDIDDSIEVERLKSKLSKMEKTIQVQDKLLRKIMDSRRGKNG